ncbi:MAG: cyclic nucleotide-binding domain-containing protein [Paracoccaceae bacterium]
MQIHGFKEILSEHPVFRDFDEDALDLLAGCARNEHFKPGGRIYGEGEPADRLFVLRQGDVAVEISSSDRAPIIVETRHAGDVLGWSWMVPPYRHTSDAIAQSEVRAISLDATCMRGKCDENPVLGYHLFKYLLPHMAKRIRVLRMQLLDLYGAKQG